MALLSSLKGGVTSRAPSYATFAAAGVIKYAEERLLATTAIGNGTYMSGAIKLGIGAVAKEIGGNSMISDAAAIAFITDGVEDIITNFMSGTSYTIGAGNTSYTSAVIY